MADSADRPSTHQPASIEDKIASLADWRGLLLAQIQQIARRHAPQAQALIKWRGVPTWSDHGLLFTAETYQKAVKMTFAQGARLDDPAGLFNASLTGKTRRAIDFGEGSKIPVRALGSLMAAAVAHNRRR